MRRILIVNSIPSPYNDALFRELANVSGIDLRVAFCAWREANRSWELPADKGYDYAVLRGWTWRDPHHVNPGIVSFVRRTAPDVAVLSGSYTMPTMQLAAATLGTRRTPWAYWGEELDMRPLEGVRHAARRLLRRTIVRADGILAIGSRARTSYIRAGAPAAHVADFRYYADTRRFAAPEAMVCEWRQALRAEWAASADQGVLLFTGQMVWRKGVDTLLRALALVTSKSRPLAILAGDGPQRAEFEALARSLGVADYVRFAGFVQPDRLPSYFAAADAFVLPSRHEGWGVVVHEALAAGLPVIASDRVNAAADLVAPGRNGWLVPADDPSALARAIEQFLELAGDPAALARSRAHARDVAEGQSPRHAARRMVDLLCAVMQRQPIEGR